MSLLPPIPPNPMRSPHEDIIKKHPEKPPKKGHKKGIKPYNPKKQEKCKENMQKPQIAIIPPSSPSPMENPEREGESPGTKPMSMSMSVSISMGSTIPQPPSPMGHKSLDPPILSQGTLTFYMMNHFSKSVAKVNYEKQNLIRGKNSLSRHTITETLRAKMVDWMIEVLATFESSTTTYFKAVRIMDAYLHMTKYSLSASDIHIIGICCIFLASKMEDYHPIMMVNVISMIAHNAFTDSHIKQVELEILKTFKFRLPYTAINEFIDQSVVNFAAKCKTKFGEEDLPAIQKIMNLATFYAKMTTYEYSFLNLRYILEFIYIYIYFIYIYMYMYIYI